MLTFLSAVGAEDVNETLLLEIGSGLSLRSVVTPRTFMPVDHVPPVVFDRVIVLPEDADTVAVIDPIALVTEAVILPAVSLNEGELFTPIDGVP